MCQRESRRSHKVRQANTIDEGADVPEPALRMAL